MKNSIYYNQFHINATLAEIIGFTEFHPNIGMFFEGGVQGMKIWVGK